MADVNRPCRERDMPIRATLDTDCAALLAELGLAMPGDDPAVTPLNGGVSSEVARVDVAGRSYCLKFALAKLKVKEDWFAPVDRNRTEYTWLRIAAEILPGNALVTYGRSERLNGFAMEYISGPDNYLWKDRLLSAGIDLDDARAVGGNLGKLHKVSARPGFDRSGLSTARDFRSLRIEPYLHFSAQAHPAQAPALERIARGLEAADGALIHGDASPKNIIFRPTGPVLLDAECATMGDPAFDPAFCMNHLVLKAVHLPGHRRAMLAGAAALWDAYAEHVDWEPRAAVEARTAELLPALMLARIDGKSPVEYLTDAHRRLVRGLALSLLDTPDATIPALLGRIASNLETHPT